VIGDGDGPHNEVAMVPVIPSDDTEPNAMTSDLSG
jgi:hypothetical protein